MSAASASHRWKFVRIGGVDQVVLRTGADLAGIGELDQKLWMSLAMPTTGVQFDAKTAALIDTDGDGRIRPPEVIAAVKWAAGALKDLGDLIKGGDSVALSAIKDPDILAGARRILASLGKPAAESITLHDVSDTVKILSETRFNGDGVVTIESAEEAALKQAIAEIIETVGGVPDRSGRPGVDGDTLARFFAEIDTLTAWAARGEADRALTPLGLEATVAAAEAVKTVRAKVDDFFARTRLAAFDGRAVAALNRTEAEYLAVAARDLTITSEEIAALPLARIAAAAELPLEGALNPAWSGAIERLRAVAVGPLLGARSTLSEADWGALRARLAPYEEWSLGKPTTVVEKLGLPRLRELVSSGTKDRIAALIAQDAALEAEFSQMDAVEKLVRFQRDLHELLTNFVNFADFYGRSGAVFQTGTLYLDNRSCHLCIDVSDPARHAQLAHLSGACLAYCQLSRSGGASRQIVAVFTAGSSDNLIVGRNGVFYDRSGQDWDATIVKIVSSPVSVGEAFWSPYKKLARMIEEQIAKRASRADVAVQQRMAQGAETAATLDQQKPEPKAEPKKIDTGTLAAIGLVMTTLLGALGTIFAAILKLPAWQIPLVMVGIVLGISLPSMFMAYWKLRKRNLGPILDANGWAINNAAKMNLPFGRSLTDVATLPPGAERSMSDPYSERGNRWPLVLLIVVGLTALGWFLDSQGLIHTWTRGHLGRPPIGAQVGP